LDFFRICQEALSNIMNHAGASSVKIRLEKLNDEICLTIQDDGKGFELGQQKITPGLTNIRERVASINGQLKVKTGKGLGTCVCVTISSELYQ
jgi:signal transduction histidine kinase